MTATMASQPEKAVAYVPGSIPLLKHGHLSKSSNGFARQSQEISLSPIPSDLPDDPLNWSSLRKARSVVCMCLYTLAVGISSATIYSILEQISASSDLPLSDLNAGTGYMFLSFGLGCLFWQPLACHFGKRPIYLLSVAGTLVTQVLVPYNRTNGQWIANKIMQGFFGAPIESLCEISITDVFFRHERGKYISLYALILGGSSFAAPVFAGLITDRFGWEWVLYGSGILCAIVLILLIFLLEETNYRRRAAYDSEEAKRGETRNRPDRSAWSDLISTQSCYSNMSPPRRDHLSKPSHVLRRITSPFRFFSFPVVLFSGCMYGSNLIWFNVLNATASLVLGSPPYDFPAWAVGVAYLAPLLGAVIGTVYTGFLGDWIVVWGARRKDGITEPEHRLWLFAPSIVLTPSGLILWGVGAAHALAWPLCVLAMSVVAFISSVGMQLAILYCIDTYQELAAEAMVTVILIRNTMSFAIGYGVTPWVTNLGLQNSFIVAAAVSLIQGGIVMVWTVYGRKLRKFRSETYATYVDRMQ